MFIKPRYDKWYTLFVIVIAAQKSRKNYGIFKRSEQKVAGYICQCIRKRNPCSEMQADIKPANNGMPGCLHSEYSPFSLVCLGTSVAVYASLTENEPNSAYISSTKNTAAAAHHKTLSFAKSSLAAVARHSIASPKGKQSLSGFFLKNASLTSPSAITAKAQMPNTSIFIEF